MSLHHENFAWNVEMSALKKMVLLFVAREANLNNRECSPSIQLISFKCGMSDSSVRGFLKELEAEGHIESMKVRGKGTVYRVNLGLPA
jgi:predicted transcriptional regulator